MEKSRARLVSFSLPPFFFRSKEGALLDRKKSTHPWLFLIFSFFPPPLFFSRAPERMNGFFGGSSLSPALETFPFSKLRRRPPSDRKYPSFLEGELRACLPLFVPIPLLLLRILADEMSFLRRVVEFSRTPSSCRGAFSSGRICPPPSVRPFSTRASLTNSFSPLVVLS